jgi:hypothetical protein
MGATDPKTVQVNEIWAEEADICLAMMQVEKEKDWR